MAGFHIYYGYQSLVVQVEKEHYGYHQLPYKFVSPPVISVCEFQIISKLVRDIYGDII